MIAGSEEAVAEFDADAGVGGPVFVDEAAVEEIGVACAAIDEGGADLMAPIRPFFRMVW